MATKIGSLFGDVSLRTTDFNKGVKSIQKNLATLGKSMTNTGKSLSGKVTAPLAAFGALSVNAFNKQIEAEAGLKAALGESGQEVDNNLERIKNIASEIQKVSTVGDETSLGLAQVGTSMGLAADQMQPALEGALGLSEAFGIDLKTAMRASAGALQGQTEALTRYIPELKGIDDVSGRVALVQQKMAEGFGVVQAKAKEGSGPLKQLSNSFGDLMERVGGVIAEALTPMVDWLQKVVDSIQENVSPEMLELGVKIGAIVAAVGPALIILGTMATVMSALSVPVLAVVAGIAAFAAGMVLAWEFGENVLGPWLVNLIEGFSALWQMVKDLASAFKDKFVAALTFAWQGVKSFITGAIDSLMSKLTKLWDFFVKVKDSIGNLGGKVSGGFSSIAESVGFRAEGGPVASGSPYIVGERGPELFVPRYSGSIVPNNELGGSGGGTVIHQHFNGNMDLAAVAAIKNMKPTLVKWAVDGVREDGLRRV
tara:strand:+ start:3891 stop:5339 length:1449 start_codon:yes stop_codon:yes gene_type:complete